MVDRPWQMFLLNPRGLTRHEGDRLLEKAGIGRLSLHVTETEAKGTAKEALRKLRAVDDTDWTACYVQPFEVGVGKEPGDSYPRIRVIRSGDVG